jgi:hypothetical protein
MNSSLKIRIPKLHIDDFDWSTWRAGILVWELIGNCCQQNIFDNKEVLREHAVGYIPSQNLTCRPCLDEYAVMFIINDVFCWTHFREEEFKNVFTE